VKVGNLRTFLSYDIDEPSILSRVREFQRNLISTGADLKLVRPEILHFTIRFLGEINDKEKEKIIQVLEGKIAPSEVEARFKGIGTFPNDKRISVIWIGSDEKSALKLEEQAKAINARLEQEIPTLPKENVDRFNPHITIARMKTGRNKNQLVAYLQQHKDEDFGSARIGKLRLKLSDLTPEGPIYTDLHVFS
jgi:RNA 2',3'-cyclic 3'-phosphodiesterase